ncbi:MAG TPA: hypothetical protein HA230_02370 [Candidatus Aenigmarchaeota archaeon]|nr:hypothetical protein [Candidatus Aenigmarchaeota archaeon]
MKTKILLTLAFVLFATVAFAQTSDKIILVSDTNSVDMNIAKAAGEKAGIPVLVLEDGILNNDLKNSIADVDAKTIILVGGPSVIKPEIETELQNLNYNVIRLWGMERTGTAVEVAKYFWQGGSGCVVIADDTMNNEDDTETQTEASTLASSGKCPFLPVPEGKIPAEVLDILKDLNVSEAKFVGSSSSSEFRAKFAKLHMKEIIGDKNKINDYVASEVENTTKRDGGNLKLNIIAAPQWKDILGHGGHAEKHTIVRIVSSTDAISKLIELIKSKNITDVRVLGSPALSDSIASALEAQNITVKKISGEKASDVARNAMKESLLKWEEKRREAAANDIASREKIRKRLYELLNKIEDRINHLEIEITQLNASGANPNKIADLQSKIDDAQSQISAIKTYIDNNNFETARLRMVKLLGDIEKMRWQYRADIKLDVNEDLRDEQHSLEETQDNGDVSSIHSKLAELRTKCNSTSIETIVEKATSLKQPIQAAKSSGDFTNASQLALEMRDLKKQAEHLSKLCEKLGVIEKRLQHAAEKRVERAQAISKRLGRD